MAHSLKLYIENLLKTDERLIDENNEIRGNLIRELANKLDEKLIELLLNDEKARNAFFLKIKGVYVFKHNEFKFFLDENKIDNSYTQYENRIGLATGSKMLNENQDVVLNFPYKDCVLEGGQSTEEGMDTYFEYNDEKAKYEEKQAKRKEIFFNEVLALDEIDRLFEPKAFTNIRKHSQKGEEIPTSFTRDENGVIKDNLIIKGNNLLALHSLKKEFKGQIKLIYIDPPYNTGNDGFKYNDNFNHSSWLLFMKNRLEIARELLKEDGVIFVHCDDNEQAYLKVLMDDIFYRENFISNIVWKGRGGRQDSKYIAQVHETIIVFSKSKEQFLINKNIIADDSVYQFYDENKKRNYKTQLIRKWGSNSRREDRPNLFYEVEFEGNIILPILPSGADGCWRWSKKKLEKAIQDKMVVMLEKNQRIELYEKIFQDNGLKEIVYNSWFDETYSGQGAKHLEEIFKDKVFAYPKPEQLIKKIIEIGSLMNDIVLDFNLGSGTTASTAHKMGRRYMGIEQMCYVEEISVERLKMVIAGEKGGVSTAVNWQGGGSFIYLELAKNNEQAKEMILECKNYEELIDLFDVLYEEFFLHYNVKIKNFKEKISKEENFINLPLIKQQEMFCKMLDLNQMYVNASEMEDSRYKLSNSDISPTKDFYQIKE